MNIYRLIQWLGIAAIAAIVVFLGVEILHTARQEVPQTAISKPFETGNAHFKATFDTDLISDAHFLTTVKPDVSEPIRPEIGSDVESGFSAEIPVEETDDSWWLEYSSASESSSGPLAVSSGFAEATSNLFSSSTSNSLSGGTSSSSGAPSSSSASSSSGSTSSGSTSAAAGGTDKGTSSPSSEDEKKGSAGGIVNNQEGVLDWIEREGIRAGFMSSTAGNLSKISRYISVAKGIGLNTVIVYGCSFAESSNHFAYYREWLRLCNRAGLHVFVFYPWQPPVGNSCRRVVFSDGTEGLFPCPLDNQLWQKYLTEDMVHKLARISVGSPVLKFDGYFLDMEMYRTENEPANKKNYSRECCFCDNCFSTFLFSKGYSGGTLPAVNKKNRYRWLEEHRWLDEYFAFLGEKVEALSQELQQNIHLINPRLLLGVYPALTDKNWVLQSVMRGFSRDSYPVISFSTDTYGYFLKPWGADRIPADLHSYFEEYDINGIYVAGYLLRGYSAFEIREHLIKSCQRSQGYWLFRLPQLVDDDIPVSEALAGGTQDDYLRAIREANTYAGKP